MCVCVCVSFFFLFWVFVAQSFWFLFVFVEVWKIERVGKKLWVKIGGMWWRHRTKKRKRKKRPDDGFLCRSTSRRRRERYAFLSSRRSSCDLASWQSARCRQDLVVILTHSFSSLDLVRVGAKIFKTKCAQCHVAEPGGGHKQVRLRVSFGHKRTGMDEIAVPGTRWTRFGRFEPSDRVFTTLLSLRYSRLEFVDRWSR